MSVKTIRAGVIGLGVGERHVAGYDQIEDCEVAAICDLDTDKLTRVGDHREIGTRVTDWRKIVEDPEIDVVSICSYDDAHAEQAEAAFRNGKHVMIEKPIALDKGEAEAVLRAQQDSGCLISSNLILRQSPRFQEIRRMVQDGAFGDPFYLEGDYIHQILWKITEGWRGKMDFYCVTYGGGIHLIDLMRWILGREVTEVSGMGGKVLTRDSAFPYPDTIVNLLRFEGDVIAKTLTTFGPQRPHLHALTIYGTKATFVNERPDGRFYQGDDDDGEAVTTPYPAIEKSDLLPDFIAAVREGREPIVGARDVFRVMDICFAAWESVRSGRTVEVSYVL